MFSEILLAQLSMLNVENTNVFINDSNAYAIGIDLAELRNRFFSEKGRVILTNENIKVSFDNEGQHLNFSTFDNVAVSVDFNAQKVAPNKGSGDDFGR